MNELIIQEYLDNRARYVAEGRSIEAKIAQQEAQDIAWAYEPDEEINPEPWAQKDFGGKQ